MHTVLKQFVMKQLTIFNKPKIESGRHCIENFIITSANLSRNMSSLHFRSDKITSLQIHGFKVDNGKY